MDKSDINWIPSNDFYKSELKEDKTDNKETAVKRYFNLNFDEFLKDQENKKPILLIGSGFSLSSGLPNWSGLMEKLLSEYSDLVNNQQAKYKKCRGIIEGLDNILKNILKADSSAEHLIDFAEYLKLQFSRFPEGIEKFEGALKNILKMNISNNNLYSPNNNHEILSKMFPYISGIITTNYDTLIEDALISESSKQQNYGFDINKNVYKYYEGKKLENDLNVKQDHKFIIKIHGCINDSGLTNKLILGRKDYSILSIEHSKIFQVISKIYNLDKNQRLIILGYSLNDRDILNLLSYITNLKGPVKNVFITGLSIDEIVDHSNNNKDYKWMNVHLYNIFMLPYPVIKGSENEHQNLKLVLEILLEQLSGSKKLS